MSQGQTSIKDGIEIGIIKEELLIEELMLKPYSQFDFNNCSDAELKAWLKQTIPAVRQFVKAAEIFCYDKAPSPCDTCDKKNECGNLCDQVKDLLPKVNKGASNREKLSDDIIDLVSDVSSGSMDKSVRLGRRYLRAIDKDRSEEIFKLYKNCSPETFTAEQWEVVYLRFNLGLKHKDIAKVIGMKQTTVSDRLRRAKNNMHNYYRRKKT